MTLEQVERDVGEGEREIENGERERGVKKYRSRLTYLERKRDEREPQIWAKRNVE